MSWMDEYRARLKPADEALSVVQSGQRVYVHQGCAEPEDLIKAMVRRAPELWDVEVMHLATMGSADYTKPEYEGHFRHNTCFIGANVREAVQAGRADYIPIFLHEIEELFRSGVMPIDVALIQCCPPDHYGYMSLGTGIDITLTRRVQEAGGDRCAPGHRAPRGQLDPQWSHAADGHRGHSGRCLAHARRPQGPGRAHRDVLRRRDRPD
jgi:acyl-CoA hydrolase